MVTEWNHRLECWLSLKYPMKRELRAKLAKLYFEICGETRCSLLSLVGALTLRILGEQFCREWTLDWSTSR